MGNGKGVTIGLGGTGFLFRVTGAWECTFSLSLESWEFPTILCAALGCGSRFSQTFILAIRGIVSLSISNVAGPCFEKEIDAPVTCKKWAPKLSSPFNPSIMIMRSRVTIVFGEMAIVNFLAKPFTCTVCPSPAVPQVREWGVYGTPRASANLADMAAAALTVLPVSRRALTFLNCLVLLFISFTFK